METRCVFFQVGTECFNIICKNFVFKGLSNLAEFNLTLLCRKSNTVHLQYKC
jgi:hypothetical protein